MKKNISINISGIIFHIEEEGYDQLKNYLNSINDYFASFEENDEIVADIESRIAEIFLSKLNDGKQVITPEDVSSLIATMGSVEDFQALEEHEGNNHKKESKKKRTSGYRENSKKLYRDSKRRLLGGVSAGIAHYFNIDPLWIRLIIFLLAVGSVGVIAFAYVIFWAAIPESATLEEDAHIKKMYRNPDNKVIGGVASGIASYFGVDTSIIRLLLIISIFLGGAGIISYVILWIILPEAKTITEKVQMQGDPVTLSNIESNIKQSLNVKEGEENVFIKIILFPFRLISIVLAGLAKGLGPLLLFLVEAIRVLAGFLLGIVGLSLFFSLIVSTVLLLGWVSNRFVIIGDKIPVEMVSTFIPPATTVAAFFFAVIPSIVLILLGLSIIAKRKLFSTMAGWSLFAVWMVALVFLGFTIPSIIYNFSEKGTYQVTNSYPTDDSTLVLKLQEAGIEHYDKVRLRIEGHSDDEVKVVLNHRARGSSRRVAIENAKQIVYNVSLQDSIFAFDSNLSLPESTPYKAQQVDATLYIPFQQPFIMKSDLKFILNNNYRYDYHHLDFENKTWITTPAGLECTSCENGYSYHKKSRSEGNYRSKFNFKDFDELSIGNAFAVNITYADNYRIDFKGHESDIDRIKVIQDGNLVIMKFDEEDAYPLEGNLVEVNLQMPELNTLKMSGRSKAYVKKFKQEAITVELLDESTLEANFDVETLDILLEDAADMSVKGSGELLKATLKGAAKFDASNFRVEQAAVIAEGTSEARLYVNDRLSIAKSIVATVENKGDATISSTTTEKESEE